MRHLARVERVAEDELVRAETERIGEPGDQGDTVARLQ